MKDLKAELKAAGLSTTGKKADLMARVVARRKGADQAITGGQTVKIAIVTYGNGVRTALHTTKQHRQQSTRWAAKQGDRQSLRHRLTLPQPDAARTG